MSDMSELDELLAKIDALKAKAAAGPMSFSPQSGKPGECMLAQVWNDVGDSLAQFEPSDSEGVASASAELCALFWNNAPEALRAAADRIEKLEARGALAERIIACFEYHGDDMNRCNQCGYEEDEPIQKTFDIYLLTAEDRAAFKADPKAYCGDEGTSAGRPVEMGSE